MPVYTVNRPNGRGQQEGPGTVQVQQASLADQPDEQVPQACTTAEDAEIQGSSDCAQHQVPAVVNATTLTVALIIAKAKKSRKAAEFHRPGRCFFNTNSTHSRLLVRVYGRPRRPTNVCKNRGKRLQILRLQQKIQIKVFTSCPFTKKERSFPGCLCVEDRDGELVPEQWGVGIACLI